MNEEKRAYDDKTAAHYLGLSPSTLRQLRIYGSKPGMPAGPKFLKIGRAIRYLKEDLDAWLDNFQRFEHLDQARANAPESMDKIVKRAAFQAMQPEEDENA